jgi:hypothetical protein
MAPKVSVAREDLDADKGFTRQALGARDFRVREPPLCAEPAPACVAVQQQNTLKLWNFSRRKK